MRNNTMTNQRVVIQNSVIDFIIESQDEVVSNFFQNIEIAFVSEFGDCWDDF